MTDEEKRRALVMLGELAGTGFSVVVNILAASFDIPKEEAAKFIDAFSSATCVVFHVPYPKYRYGDYLKGQPPIFRP